MKTGKQCYYRQVMVPWEQGPGRQDMSLEHQTKEAEASLMEEMAWTKQSNVEAQRACRLLVYNAGCLQDLKPGHSQYHCAAPWLKRSLTAFNFLR